MNNNEKFMFDTIFDELEPILPEVEDANQPINTQSEEQGETEIDDTPPNIYNENDITAARQEGFNEGKRLGSSETLTGNEKILSDTLNAIGKNIIVIQSEQKKFNQEISINAASLSLSVVRKFFPKLNEQTSLDEIHSVVTKVIDRLVGELEIIIKVNPSISNNLSDKLNSQFDETGDSKVLSVIADESISVGDCKIHWPNGAAERDLNTLMTEIDDIIVQNSSSSLEPLEVDKLSHGLDSNNQEITEK